ncbi:Hsp33 family molecular chaperone HslO [bacterium]|nr:Hsp33 family molecular chaperone HslO [bacterium]
MEDILVKAITAGLGLRAVACTTDALSNRICRQHATSPLGSVLLSRALSAAACLGGLGGRDERVALTFEGNGPAGMILTEANGRGHVKGFIANPEVAPALTGGTLDLGEALGKAGLLTVTRDIGLGQPYTGTVHLITSLIGDDLAFYLSESEQIPSAVGVSSSLDQAGGLHHCGGFIVQSLPREGGKPVDDTVLQDIVHRIAGIGSLNECIGRGGGPEALLAAIFGEIPFEIIQRTPLEFRCSCSRERLSRALTALGRESIEAMIEDSETTEAVCEYCRKRYLFTRAELGAVLAAIKGNGHENTK